MPRSSQLPRPLLTLAAVILAVTAVLYSVLWMYAVRHQKPPVELGFDPNFIVFSQCMDVVRVQPDSPAQRAGLRPGDSIVAVNGRRLESMEPFDEVWWNSSPGDSVELTITRPGVSEPLILTGTFRAQQSTSQEGLAVASIQQVLASYPVSFLLVGIPVLFLRRDDLNAWLLALMFCGMIAAAPHPSPYSLAPALRPFFSAWRAVFLGFLGAFFYSFFAVFPTASPLERRFPWLKWLGLLLGLSISLPGLKQGEITAPSVLARWVGPTPAHWYVIVPIYSFLALGLISLVVNAFIAPDLVARRKSRLILWGTAVGVLPVVAEKAAIDFFGFHPPFWLDAALVLSIFFFPLSFAYVIVKHRVMEFPLLLKRSARYILVQRGFVVFLFVIAAVMIALFTRTFSRFFSGDSNAGMILSALFGVVLVWTSAPLIRRGTDRIDRAFFRSAYDARRILQDLAQKARTVSDRHQLAALLEHHVQEALHPKFLAGYLETEDGSLAAEFGPVPPQLTSLDPAMPLLAELTRRGKPWELPATDLRLERDPSQSDFSLPQRMHWFTLAMDVISDLSAFAPLVPEYLVPVLARDDRLIGLLVLGERRSEEPYSGEDARLLESVASQAGLALESFRLAERIAERMEAERRAAHEMEIAREVQSKLFPQRVPALETLEYAGGCIQARVVGGDYYDFLDLGPGRLGIVLADIAGKGIAGALLMANLQANLRSQYALALDDLPRLLVSVNRLFLENTPDDRYATLFFADYADADRRLRYVNCGHNPPLLLRADGSLERLAATATVLGMFANWECQMVQTSLHQGDTLVLYTDGVTEAPNAQSEEFGEKRLLAAIRSRDHTCATDLLSGISAAVQQFSSGAQADDITLVVARAR